MAMMAPTQNATFSFSGTAREVLQSIGVELMIFVVTLVVALILRRNSYFSKGHGLCDDAYQSKVASSKIPSPPTSGSLKARSSSGNSAATGEATSRSRAVRLVEGVVLCAQKRQTLDAIARYEDLRSLGSPAAAVREAAKTSKLSAVEIYGLLVQCGMRADRPDIVLVALEDMRRGSVERSLAFYESTMKLLASRKCYKEALAVYELLEADGLEPCSVTMSCLVTFAVEVGELNRAIEFFDRLAAITTPSIRAYMTLLRVHSLRHDWPKSLEVIQDMRKREVSVDSLALNIALATGVAAGRTDAAKVLLEEACQMTGKGGAPVADVVSHNTIMKGCAHSKDAEGALRLLDRMCEGHGVRPNAITFNTAMDAAARCSRFGDAWSVLGKMRQAGFKPDKFTCTTLMKGLQEGTTAARVGTMLDLLRDIRDECDDSLCSSLFRSVIEAAGRLHDTALMTRATAQMKEQGVTLTVAEYRRLLTVLSREVSSPRCVAICQQLPAEGLAVGR